MIQSMQYGAPQQLIHHGTDQVPYAKEPQMAGACGPSLVQEPSKAGTKDDKSKSVTVKSIKAPPGSTVRKVLMFRNQTWLDHRGLGEVIQAKALRQPSVS